MGLAPEVHHPDVTYLVSLGLINYTVTRLWVRWQGFCSWQDQVILFSSVYPYLLWGPTSLILYNRYWGLFLRDKAAVAQS